MSKRQVFDFGDVSSQIYRENSRRYGEPLASTLTAFIESNLLLELCNQQQELAKFDNGDSDSRVQAAQFFS